MRLKVKTTSLRETTVAEYFTRFVFGGLVTVVATLIARRWGPVIGGIFLAFPGIFPAGVSLVERHKEKREASEGKAGVASARLEAGVEAAGAAAGTWGLAAFGIVIWKMANAHSLRVTLSLAGVSWVVASCIAWVIRDKYWPRRRTVCPIRSPS